MTFEEINDLMNYNFVSEGTEFYRIYGETINSNKEILTIEQLENADAHLLPPQAYDDGRNRPLKEYIKTKTTIEMAKNEKLQKGKGMAA